MNGAMANASRELVRTGYRMNPLTQKIPTTRLTIPVIPRTSVSAFVEGSRIATTPSQYAKNAIAAIVPMPKSTR